jgi:hypothetical protein
MWELNIRMIILYWLIWKNDNGDIHMLSDFVLVLNDMIDDVIKNSLIYITVIYYRL